LLIVLKARAQRNIDISLVLNLSEENSLEATQAERKALISFWEYKFHQSANKPRLLLNGELPNLSRTIIPVTQNDGSETFRERSLATSLLELSLIQNIAPTGGTFFASSQVNRIDIFGTSATTSYLAYPVLVGIKQPIGSFNALKWANRIEPIRYEESKKQFKEDLELSKIKGLQLYFGLLYAQENLKIKELQLKNADTLFRLAKNRLTVGKITENEFLRNEINFLQAEQETEQSRAEYIFAKKQFQLFFNIQDSLILQRPKLPPKAIIEEQTALTRLRESSTKSLQIQKKLLEAERQLAQARANAGLKMDITLSFGLSKSANSFNNLYSRLQDQQNARITFQVPILDWQRGKSEIKQALLRQKSVELQTKQEMSELEIELIRQIHLWQLAQKQLNIALKTQESAEKSYQITFKEYLAGYVGLNELDKALEAKNIASQNYLRQLETIWLGYYKIRLLTLYDFEKNIPLD
jgi:hypothetical protein